MLHVHRFASVLLALALLAAACGGDEPVEEIGAEETDATETSTETGSPAAAADVPQELVVAYPDDQFNIDINLKRLGMYPYNLNICEPLLGLTNEFGLEPVLATEYEFVGDNTYRFHLRDGVTFHDGQTLDAEAVEYTIDYTVAEPSTGYSFLTEDSVTVVDETTVDIQPGQPNLRLPEQIQHPTYAIIAPGSDPTVEPVCTGPFQFVEYVQNEHLVAERFEDYWGEPAQLERLTFRFIPDEATRALALQSGEVDVIADVDRAQANTLDELPGIKVVNADPGQVHLIYVAQQGPDGAEKITSDVRVRRAIAHAIDQEAYVNGVLDGNGEVVETVNPPSILGDHADLVEGVAYDPEAARALLEEAGWTSDGEGVRTKDGQPLELTMIFQPARVTLASAEFVQAQLAEVGIQANIVQHADAAAYTDQLNAGNFDIDIEVPNQNDANPSFLLALRWYSQSQVPSAAYMTLGPDSEFDRLVAEAQQATEFEEVQRLSAEAMHELVDVEVAAIPLAGTYRIYAMREAVQGFDPHPSGINQDWTSVYLSEE